jgi:hypothetical protein
MRIFNSWEIQATLTVDDLTGLHEALLQRQS